VIVTDIETDAMNHGIPDVAACLVAGETATYKHTNLVENI